MDFHVTYIFVDFNKILKLAPWLRSSAYDCNKTVMYLKGVIKQSPPENTSMDIVIISTCCCILKVNFLKIT